MSGLRDYVHWHRAYDDPESDLSWRLRTVQGYLHVAFDTCAGPLRVLSVCAGEGRDVIGVLTERDDAARIDVHLIELHPTLARRAVTARPQRGLDESRWWWPMRVTPIPTWSWCRPTSC